MDRHDRPGIGGEADGSPFSLSLDTCYAYMTNLSPNLYGGQGQDAAQAFALLYDGAKNEIVSIRMENAHVTFPRAISF